MANALSDALRVPPTLVKFHQTLDCAVDAAYISAEKAAARKHPSAYGAAPPNDLSDVRASYVHQV